jgi:RNA polymerase sigma-70 factor (ECF subfamily)
MTHTPSDLHTTIVHTFEGESRKVLASLIKHLRDVELAEDVLQDAFVVALEQWATTGIPRNPAAWLLTTARRKAIDRLRRAVNFNHKQADIFLLDTLNHSDDPMDTDDIPDERLKLIFTCCHPSLAFEAQVALTLQVIAGMETRDIAHAFLVPLPTMAQRIVRAKRKIRDAGIPYIVPSASNLHERLDAVLEVLYLIFNAGYVAPHSDQLSQLHLCDEAIRLCRVLTELLRQASVGGELAEALGLQALMLLHHARRHARTDANGEIIVLEEQDRALWDNGGIQEGVALLDEAMRYRQTGSYQLQAAIAALHDQAPTSAATDWAQIALLYQRLHQIQPSPVVALNHAVAVAMSEGYLRGLRLLDEMQGLDGYHWYHAARADLLRRSGWHPEAIEAYERALALCQNTAERHYLQRRLASLQP